MGRLRSPLRLLVQHGRRHGRTSHSRSHLFPMVVPKRPELDLDRLRLGRPDLSQHAKGRKFRRVRVLALDDQNPRHLLLHNLRPLANPGHRPRRSDRPAQLSSSRRILPQWHPLRLDQHSLRNRQLLRPRNDRGHRRRSQRSRAHSSESPERYGHPPRSSLRRRHAGANRGSPVESNPTRQRRHRQPVRNRLPPNRCPGRSPHNEFRSPNGRNLQHEHRLLHSQPHALFTSKRRLCSKTFRRTLRPRHSSKRPSSISIRSRLGSSSHEVISRQRLHLFRRPDALRNHVRLAGSLRNASTLPQKMASPRPSAKSKNVGLPIHLNPGLSISNLDNHHHVVGRTNEDHNTLRPSLASADYNRLLDLESPPKIPNRYNSSKSSNSTVSRLTAVDFSS